MRAYAAESDGWREKMQDTEAYSFQCSVWDAWPCCFMHIQNQNGINKKCLLKVRVIY